MSFVSNLKNNKGSSNRDDYIVLDKKMIEDKFFLSLFIIVIILFGVILFNGITTVKDTAISESQPINMELVASYQDKSLNVLYAIPGGDSWVMAELEDAGLEDIVNDSKGSDGLFDIHTDLLMSEVLTTACFNRAGQEGYEQFMSFTFTPLIDADESKYVNNSIENFKTEISVAENIEVSDYTFLGSKEYANDGLMLKASVVQEIDVEQSDGSMVKQDTTLYYTRYIKKVGVNLMVITFGSVSVDDSVDPYLEYFANSLVNINSLSQ